ncbi:MAG: YihY/virulence factor BrkB family protein [Nitrospirae bacterium]|nr:YihY/virulence factor BrkB family protein [Nitrospirota bacterium]
MKLIFKSITDFFKDDGPLLAGSISYFFVMAIIPFSFIIIAIIGYVLGEKQEFYAFLLNKLLNLFPKATYSITKELGKIITFKRIGFFTLLIYGIFSYQLYSAVERALNIIFKIGSKRSLVLSILLSISLVTLMITLLLISFGATSVISMVKILDQFFPGLVISRIAGFLIAFVIPLFLTILTATALYILLPKRRVLFIHALLGGLFTALFIEAAKHVFTFYVASKLYKLGAVYGPISAFITFLMWVFYAVSIFLIGAEVVHNLGDRRKTREIYKSLHK